MYFKEQNKKNKKTVALFVFLMLALKSHKKKNRLKMVPSYRKLNRKYQLHMKTCFLWTFAWNRSKHFREIVCIKSVRKKRIITNMVSSIVTTGSFVGFFFLDDWQDEILLQFQIYHSPSFLSDNEWKIPNYVINVRANDFFKHIWLQSTTLFL